MLSSIEASEVMMFTFVTPIQPKHVDIGLPAVSVFLSQKIKNSKKFLDDQKKIFLFTHNIITTFIFFTHVIGYAMIN
jgi:hypothetical protein